MQTVHIKTEGALTKMQKMAVTFPDGRQHAAASAYKCSQTIVRILPGQRPVLAQDHDHQPVAVSSPDTRSASSAFFSAARLSSYVQEDRRGQNGPRLAIPSLYEMC